MLTTHAAGSATVPPIASCSFVFRVVGFIVDDLKKKSYVWLFSQGEAITSVALGYIDNS